MDLWIRSQDKEKLLQVNDICVENKRIVGYFDKQTEYEDLGIYATRERALEILDEIENFKDATTIINLADKKSDLIIELIKKYGSFSYKMPKE